MGNRSLTCLDIGYGCLWCSNNCRRLTWLVPGEHRKVSRQPGMRPQGLATPGLRQHRPPSERAGTGTDYPGPRPVVSATPGSSSTLQLRHGWAAIRSATREVAVLTCPDLQSYPWQMTWNPPLSRLNGPSPHRGGDAERTIASRMEGSPQPERERPGYRPGSVEDFDRLYEATNHRLFATLVTLLRDRDAAEDCLQEAYLRAFRAWQRWRADAPAEAWLHRIAINVAVSHRRRERLREVGEVIRRLGLPVDPDPAESVV